MRLTGILKGELSFLACGSGVLCCHTLVNESPSEYSCCQEAAHSSSKQAFHQMGHVRLQ